MIKIYFSYIEDDDVGEVEGMFDENDSLLDLWSSNDGNWRNEYFSGFLKKLGIVVDTSGSLTTL